MAIVAQIRGRFCCFVPELVQLRYDARIKVRDMALRAVIALGFRGNAVGNQLEGLVVGPGVGAAFSDIGKAGSRGLVEAAGHEHFQNIEVRLSGGAVDRVLGSMYLEGIELAVVDAAIRE